ncbi:MAG: GspE/PulE family protein [Pirellulaceae bacterium]
MSARPGSLSESSRAQVKNDSLTELSSILGQDAREDLSEFKAQPDYLQRFDISFSRKHQCLAVTQETSQETSQETFVAFCSHEGWRQMDCISRVMRSTLEPLLVSETVLAAAINMAYSSQANRTSQTDELIDLLEPERLIDEAISAQSEDLLDTTGRAPVIQLVNQLLFDAVVAGASDIHIQPAEDHLLVRQRVDGVLFDSQTIPKVLQEEILTRVKVLGQMNIAEKRLPQDGRATVELGDRVVDLRIASLPTSHNERIVIRLLDKSARLYTLGELGMDARTLEIWSRLIRLDHGLILVTGPTGSGKSTTLYSALQEVNSTELNVLTIEDPIEYQLPGISQSQVNEKKGMTFAASMRSILRQDPDIIMVGEIRDRETATMAIQASLTGHLVFSTLHTNDAASAVTRLLDLGIEPYLISSSLVASLAQRLVRKLCNHCSELDPAPHGTRTPNGCSACRQTGFAGRVGLFELLMVDDPSRKLIQERASSSQLREHAIASGMKLLSEDGRRKVESGATTLSEVMRATSANHGG